MRSIFFVLLITTLFHSIGFSYGLENIISKEEGVIKSHYRLRCNPQSKLCESLCGQTNSCRLPEDKCVDCYKDTDLTMRSLFNGPQRRYSTGEIIYDLPTTVRILQDPYVYVVGVRKNLLMDPLKSAEYEKLQQTWNDMCPSPRAANENAFFLMRKHTNGYQPFALMCGEQVTLLIWEISYGRGEVAERYHGDVIVRPENTVILKMSYELGGVK